MQTNPGQWAEDLYVQTQLLTGLEAIALIQAAFAEREARLVGALRNLENANDRACGARPQKVYDAMIAAGMTDALIELDDARREARATLAALKDRTHG